MIVEQVDELIMRERLDAARARIEGGLAAADRVTRWRLQVRRAELGADEDEEQAIDDVLLLLEDLLAETTSRGRFEAELDRVHAARVDGLAQKRCPALVEAAVAAAGPLAERPRVLVARGRAALWADDRTGAAELYRRAIAAGPDDAAPRLALAELLYVLGDLAACQAELSRIPSTDASWASGARLRASCLAASSDPAGEAAVWRALLAARPDGDRVTADRVGLGLALAAQGLRAEALDEFRAVWRAEPEHPRGRWARRRVEHLEGAAPDAPRRWLRAFPTTVQKWDYCGPAVLELCLRYLGLELDQDEIASVVKREGGTPMYEIVAYLDALDIEARRIAATPARLRAAIDLGLPVIVQEEYSTTAHVAVITGYDEALGLFISQDPATRRPQLKSFEWSAAAGRMFGNGGVIVLGRRGAAAGASPDLTALRERATAAGLCDAEHLKLLDACDRRRPATKVGEGDEEDDGVALEEVVRLCDDAVRLDPTFRLALHRRFRALAGLGSPRALEELHRIRTRFGAEVWAHQLHGRWLMAEGRHDEAYAEYADAFRTDDEDAVSRACMGECRWLTGDLRQAEKDLLGALALQPWDVRAAENLAGVYLRQLQHVDGERHDQDAEAPDERAAREADQEARLMAPQRLRSLIERPPEALARRAAHFNGVACLVHPENPFNAVVAAELAQRRGDGAAAVAAYRKAVELDPDRPTALWGLADALEAKGELAEVDALHARGLELFPRVPDGYRIWARSLARRGQPGRAEEVLARGLAALDDGRLQLLAPLRQVLGAGGATRLREVGERHASDVAFLRAVASTLQQDGALEDAAALLRAVVEEAPHDVETVYRLGQLLARTPGAADEARACLARVVELAPRVPQPRVALAWLEAEPRAAMRWLEPVVELEDPAVHEALAAVQERLGQHKKALRSLRRALEVEGEPEAGLLRLCGRHLDAGRNARVYDLAGEVAALVSEGLLGEWGLDAWFATQWEAELADRDEALELLEPGSPGLDAAWRSWGQALLGELWTAIGSPDIGLQLLDESVAGHASRASLGPVCRRALADTLGKRAAALAAVGRPGGAQADLAQAADLYEALGPARITDLVGTLAERARLLHELERTDEALACAERACRAAEAARPVDEEQAEELVLVRAEALRARARIRPIGAPGDAAALASIDDARQALALIEQAHAVDEGADDADDADDEDADADDADADDEDADDEGADDADADDADADDADADDEGADDADSDDDGGAEGLEAVGEAALELASLLALSARFDEARRLLERMRERLEAALARGAPVAALSPQVCMQLSSILCDQGEAPAARDLCARLIAAVEASDEPDPGAIAEARHTLGIVSLDLLSDVKTAVDAYTQVIDGARGPVPHVLTNRAYALLRALHPERALTDADRVLDELHELRAQPGGGELHMTEALALRCVAGAYDLLEEREAAREACERSIALLEQVPAEDEPAGHLAEMQALLGSLRLAGGDRAGAVESTTRAVEALVEIVTRGHRQSEMDLVKALRAHGSALGVTEAASALATLARAEEITARWIDAGGAFQDVLADVHLRRGLIQHAQGEAALARASLERGRALLEEAIARGRTHMLPELVRHTTARIELVPDEAPALLERLAVASRGAVAAAEEDDLPPSSLLARRRARLAALVGPRMPA